MAHMSYTCAFPSLVFGGCSAFKLREDSRFCNQSTGRARLHQNAEAGVHSCKGASFCLAGGFDGDTNTDLMNKVGIKRV